MIEAGAADEQAILRLWLNSESDGEVAFQARER